MPGAIAEESGATAEDLNDIIRSMSKNPAAYRMQSKVLAGNHAPYESVPFISMLTSCEP